MFIMQFRNINAVYESCGNFTFSLWNFLLLKFTVSNWMKSYVNSPCVFVCWLAGMAELHPEECWSGFHRVGQRRKVSFLTHKCPPAWRWPVLFRSFLSQKAFREDWVEGEMSSDHWFLSQTREVTPDFLLSFSSFVLFLLAASIHLSCPPPCFGLRCFFLLCRLIDLPVWT